MADLLIKSLKMPKNCDCCPLCKTESAFHGICQAIRNDICYVYPYKEKPSWCPLVEVPTHGRLIDADDLILKMKPFYESININPSTGEGVSREYLLLVSAPTIVEASEEGEQDG